MKGPQIVIQSKQGKTFTQHISHLRKYVNNMDNAIPSSTHMNDIDRQNLLDDPVIPQPPPAPVIPP